jgi:hypothetical protein
LQRHLHDLLEAAKQNEYASSTYCPRSKRGILAEEGGGGWSDIKEIE